MLGWSSPALPYLTGKDSKISLSKTESFWIVPFINIAFTIGFILNPIIIEKLSRKTTLLICSIPQILSWCLIILAENCAIIYLGLLFGGISYGTGMCALAVYLSEIGNQENRGIFLVLGKLSLNLGQFFTMLLGAYFSYNSMNQFLLVIPIIFFCTFLFMPDSSYFLEKNKKSEEEMKLNSVNEMKVISLNVSKGEKLEEKEIEGNELNESKLGTKNKLNELKLWNLFIFRNNRRALLIISLCIVQSIFSGNTILKSFGQQIFTYEGSILRPEKATFLLAGISIISCLISILTIEKFKRRSLLFCFGILASLGHGIVGLFFFMKYHDFDVSCFNWLPLFGLVIYDFAITNGTINVSLAYQGELFSEDVKSLGITVSKVMLMLLSYLAAILFQLLIESFDRFVIFWIFGSICGFLSFVIFYFAPESKGKSLEEIQVMLKSTNR